MLENPPSPKPCGRKIEAADCFSRSLLDVVVPYVAAPAFGALIGGCAAGIIALLILPKRSSAPG